MRALSILLVFLSLSGCSWERRVKHLSDAEFSHYSALKVWMTEDEQKAYLKFKERFKAFAQVSTSPALHGPLRSCCRSKTMRPTTPSRRLLHARPQPSCLLSNL